MAGTVKVPDELLKPVPEGEPKITISRSMGFTVNLQGFESARIDATVTVEGSIKNKDKIIEYVNKELEHQMKLQIKDVVSQHDTKRTLLGYPK